MTAAIESPNEQSPGWVVDVATHRIVREGRRPVEPAEGGEMAQSSELDPIDNAKAVKGSHPRGALREALEKGAELLEPSQSDLRVIRIEEDTVSESKS